MRRTIVKSMLLLTCGFALIGAQSDPIPQEVPSNEDGEEVFGAGYLPYAPATGAVPLEPGRPAAGIKLDAIANPKLLQALSARFGEDKASSEDEG